MNVLLLSMPDSFEHMPPIAVRMPNGALTSLAGNIDSHHTVAVADLILVQRRVRETVQDLVTKVGPDLVGLSVMTFQRIARLASAYPEKLLVTGEDRFLGYSLMLGARAALVGMGAALTDLQARLLAAYAAGDHAGFLRLSALLDRFAAATFVRPMDGYVRRMLWALDADGVLPEDACDDPWGPTLGAGEREAVRGAVREARAGA